MDNMTEAPGIGYGLNSRAGKLLRDSNRRAAHGKVQALLGHLRSFDINQTSKSYIKAVLVTRVSEWSEQQRKF